ncbi:NRAMP family divalent metal transporter [Micromonospora zhanjiangensis]|uniref:NRAMP family divalent metal transporter n=1 Tax=Micromonospora zhanjiangensis TaxID=1522057 RepID=A0ABV8KX39_9ACTN
MKRIFTVTLGILTAVGGFVDVGDLVANSQAGARYGMRQAWVVVLGVLCICVYAEMSGRVAVVSGRATFDLVRARLGPRVALANLAGSYLVTVLTLAAEIGGVALALQLASGVPYLIWVPVAGFAVWLVLWRLRFSIMEKVFGIAGLALVVFTVALVKLPTDWSALLGQAVRPAPDGVRYWYLAVALFASAVSPYEVLFFSSGAIEERWTGADLATERANALVGFAVGGLLGLSLMATAAVLFHPTGADVTTFDQVARPAAVAFGRIGLAVAILGFFAATFGAALEVGLATGYSTAQYFGWQWGKFVPPRQAARFHTVVLVSVLLGTVVLLTMVDPIRLTIYMLVLNAVVLPLTYLPILVVANDRDYLGDRVNGRLANLLGTVFLVVLVVAAVAAVPLLVLAGGGG